MSLADIQIVAAAVTDVGLKRLVNEDSFLAESPVFLVADGMGGYEAGDRASAAVVSAFRAQIASSEFAALSDIREALSAADVGVATVAASTTRGAGSTAAGLVLVLHEDAPHWLVFNIGDSRVYRHTGNELQQLTIDHSVGQELIDRGELRRDQLSTYADRNVITRAIGAADSTADSWLMPVINGERILLCSDGLTTELEDEAIRAILTMGGTPQAVAAALVARALQNGGRDNVTVIVLDVVAGGQLGADASPHLMGVSGLFDSAFDDTTIQI